MQLDEMSKDQRSLILFFETCAVDKGGLVDARHMNGDDMEIARRWDSTGFLQFGRVKYKCIANNNTHWVELSDDAWEIAHQERRARNVRMTERREWEKTARNLTQEPAPAGGEARP